MFSGFGLLTTRIFTTENEEQYYKLNIFPNCRGMHTVDETEWRGGRLG